MALSDKGTKTARDKIKRDKFIDKFKEMNPDPTSPFKPKKPKGPNPLPLPKDFFLEKGPFKPKKRKSGPTVESRKKKKKKGKDPLSGPKFADGGKAESFGMLSVKAGVDNNPNPTQADRIVGATKKKNGGPVDSPKKKDKKKKMPGLLAIGIEIIKPKKPIKAANGGLAGRLAKRGYGKAR